MGSRSLVVAALVGVVVAGSGCSRTPVAAEGAVRVAFAGTVLNIDSRSACVVRVSSDEDDEVAGAVVDCPGASGTPAEAVVLLPAGRFDVEVGQWGCPGMPGDCPEDPFDDLYRDGPSWRAVWTCGVEVAVDAGQDVTVEAAGPTTTSGLSSTSTPTCASV